MNDKRDPKETIYIFLLAAVQVAHIIDFVVMMPLGPTLMKELHISPIQFATLVSSYNFSAAVLGILAAFIADRFDRKTILLYTMTGFTLGTLACGLSPTFITLLVARIVTGAFGGVLMGLVLAMVSDLVPYKRRGKAMGIIMSSFSVASVVGIPIGLTIADNFGWRMTFTTISGLAFIIGIISFIVFPPMRDHVSTGNLNILFRRMVNILKTPNYLKALSLMLFIGMSMFIVIPFLSPYSVKNIGIEIFQLKYMYLAGGAFTIVTAQIIGKFTDKIGAFQTFSMITLGSLIPIFLYTNAGPMSFFWYLAMSVFFMTLVSGRMIPCMTLITSIPEKKDRGTFMSIMSATRSFGSATAALVGGVIITEGASGQLERYNYSGYLSIAISAGAILVAYKVSKLKLSKQSCF